MLISIKSFLYLSYVKAVLISYFILFLCQLQAQENLIVNGDCEEYSSCPETESTPWQTPYEVTKCVGFNTPTKGTSDYFNSCTSNWIVDVPGNTVGNQFANSGQGYLGGLVFSVADGEGLIDTINAWWWEYIQGTISSPLKAGQNYQFSVYVSLAEYSSVKINEIGVYFSSDTIHTSNVFPLDTVIPQIVFSDLVDVTDTVNWVKLEGQFLATGGEKYFTIGNFKNAPQTNYARRIERYYDSLITYFYYDDFRLTEAENACNFPNVFTPNEDGVNDFIDFTSFQGKQIYILNRWGNTVLIMNEQSNYLWYGKDALGENLSEGMYYYIINDNLNSEGSIYGSIFLTR